MKEQIEVNRGILRAIEESGIRPTLENLSLEMIKTAISDMFFNRAEERRRTYRLMRDEEWCSYIEQRVEQEDDQIIF